MRMIERAEREGKLKPGGTIVEPTSGNTGVGLAIAAAIKGYRCIFVMPDKMSQEKISLLRAYGAEVVICPTAVPPESPESYYNVSDRLAEEIPGGFKPDQYSNDANPQAHYETTGPEIWEQTGGEIDAFVISVGTGGTISGTARYLKEQKPDLLVVGADPEGSIYNSPEVHPYLVEGIGEDFWPQTYDPSLVDEYVTVSDRDSFLTARALAREEGLLVGGSGGTAVYAALKVARALRPGRDDRHADPRRRPRLPVQVLRRQLDARVRLPRAAGAGADGRRGAARQARRGARRPRVRHDRVAPEGRPGDRPDAALLDLAAAGRAPRAGRVARRHRRLAPGARPARPHLQEPGRAQRGRGRRDAAAARRRRRRTRPSTRSSRR